MSQHFANPHQQQQMLQQQLLQQQLGQRGLQQQQMQMVPQQMNPQMMQMMLMIQQNPQLAAMLLQQQQQPNMGMPGQQFVPQQQMQPQLNQRFATGNVSIEQGTFQQPIPNQQQTFVPDQGAGRYGAGVPDQEEEIVSEDIPEYTVNPKPNAVPLTKKLGITPKITPFSNKTLASIPEVCYTFSIQDAVDELIKESTKIEGAKMFYTIDSVIINDSFKATFDPGYTKLFSDDVKALYKRLRGLYETATSIDTVIMLERVDKLMTEMTNHYLKINFNDAYAIERFSTDFNDLLKLLRTNHEDEEDDLWEYLSKEILEIHKLLSQDEDKKHDFSIVKPITLVYYNEHHYKMGLGDITSKMVKLSDHENNTFLLSTAAGIKELSDRVSFYIATYDRNIYRFSVNKLNEVFVELVE